MSTPGRPMATFAVGFLLLDAMLLVWFGVELQRAVLLWGGIVCAVAAVAVVLVWRRYRRTLEDLDARRLEMKAEVESIRQLLRERNLNH
jgi:cytochrome b subunit of formate dehydrogenase